MTDTPKKRVTRRLQLVDPETGEVEDRDATWDEPGKRARKGKRMTFTMLNQDREATGKLRLRGAEWQVLMQIILATSAETHEARITVGEIAATLGVAHPSVSRSIAELLERRIVYRLGRSVWRVSTHIAYRGSAEDWGQAYYSDREPIWEV